MPILTLTSDIGLRDFMVGAIKGQILLINDSLQLIDINHDLTPFNYPQAAYVCKNAIRHFPPESFHMILVNLFDVKPNHMIMAKHGDQYIGIADNGLLTMILGGLPQEWRALKMDASNPRNALTCVKVFTEAYSEILAGVPFQKIGESISNINEKHSLRPLLGPNFIEGQIIFIDHFENVIVNITREDFESQRQGRHFRIVFKRNEVIERISETYADVSEGENLALFNAAGYLEIAVNKGNAAGLFGLEGFSDNSTQNQFQQNRLYYQTVRVIFS
ncbi:MAG: SAM hydrolase/SAM-dependent halogenase family protein [Chitinophagaceae bacterium]